jgi:hypothetical protein
MLTRGEHLLAQRAASVARALNGRGLCAALLRSGRVRRIVKRQGKLVAYDVEKIVREAMAPSLRIRTAAGGVLTPR